VSIPLDDVLRARRVPDVNARLIELYARLDAMCAAFSSSTIEIRSRQ
jgi:hypothetical protein